MKVFDDGDVEGWVWDREHERWKGIRGEGEGEGTREEEGKRCEGREIGQGTFPCNRR